MKYNAKQTALSAVQDSLIIGVFDNGELTASGVEFDQLSQGYLRQLINEKEICGKVGKITLLRNVPHVTAKRVFVVGCGQPDSLSESQFKQVITKLAQELKNTQTTEATSYLHEVKLKNRDLYWSTRFMIETLENQFYCFNQFKSKKCCDAPTLQQVTFATKDASVKLAIEHTSAVAFGVKSAKDVANMPPNVCNPSYLADQAMQLAQRSTLIKTTVLGEKDMAELGMNAYLAVSRGSHNEAKLSIIEYRNHPNPNAKPIVLVGKGLTFDSGGISIKPSESMDEMKYDMGGAAAVYGVMNALSQLNLPLNVIGVLAGCENMPDANAYRPGDILTTMKGLTVEVLNTDAEGRLVLCDTLTYVERFDPECVIDIATLTGACVVALGAHNSGLMSTDEKLAEALQKAANDTLDKAWRLPLSEEYQEQLKSNFADLANIGGRWGGAITAGAFLANFTENYPWAHLDIAGTAWLQGANKGATGRPVSLLTQFLIDQVKA